jgi:hypothetical protein
MTINKTIILILFNISFYISFCQEGKKATGYFDNDNLSDTIFYKDYRFIEEYRNKDISYECKIIRGNSKIFTFNFPLGYDSLQIHQGDIDGCIETYQWKTGDNGFEINETFSYSKEYDNWILQKSETVYKTGKVEIYKPDVPTGIDGTEYKNTKIDIKGIYVVKSCQNSRFKIIITKKTQQYFYKILDNKKTIGKGKAAILYNKDNASISLGSIGGIVSGKEIQIQNYGNAMNQFIHFTQCEEKYLTFVKQ